MHSNFKEMVGVGLAYRSSTAGRLHLTCADVKHGEPLRDRVVSTASAHVQRVAPGCITQRWIWCSYGLPIDIA
jgi:hypothetical protein